MEKQVDEMLEAGILEPSDSPWSSPRLLIKKSGVNEYRFVNDLRGVNQLTKTDTLADANNGGHFRHRR